MSDIFISYSRQDKDFVGQLREALLAQAQEIWIDWESIPASQTWWNEIKKGIAKANNFVVVLSPHSMASPICQMEIEYARQLKKRIVPVVHIPYEREPALIEIAKRLAKPEESTTREIWGTRQPHDIFDANDAELKHINYFFFRVEDDFKTKFEELFAVIRTDYAHKEQHTTLQLQAQEWHRRGRDASFLLLDTELAQAQAWLAQAPGKEPVVTDLQHEYIQASEKRTRQLRNIRRASIIGSAVALIALIFAVGAIVVGVQASSKAQQARSREATANTQVAEIEQALTAVPPTLNALETQQAEGEARLTSLRLAAQSEMDANGAHPDRGVLLALEALENYPYVWQAERALAIAVQRTRLRHLIANAPGFQAHGFSAGDRFLSSVRFPDYATVVESDRVCQPDNSYSDFNAPEMYHVWALATEQQIFEWEGCALLWSPAQANHVALVGPTETIIQDIENSELLATFPGYATAWSPNGTQLALLQGENLQIVDVQTQEFLFVIQGRYPSWSPDGARIITWDNRTLWDAKTGQQIHVLDMPNRLQTTPPPGFDKLVWSPDSQRVLGVFWQEAGIFDVSSGERLMLYNLTVDPHPTYAVLWPDKAPVVAFSVGSTGLLDVILTEFVDQGAEVPIIDESSESLVSSMAWQPQWSVNGELATISSGSTLRVDRPPIDGDYIEFSLYSELPAEQYNLKAVWSMESSYIAASVNPSYMPNVLAEASASLIHIWDAGEIAVPLPANDVSDPWTVTAARENLASPDGRLEIRVDGDAPVVVNLASGAVIQDLPAFTRADWSFNGQFFMTHQTSGALVLPSQTSVWNSQSQEERLTFTNAYQVEWAPHTNRLLVSFADSVEVWDVEQGVRLFDYPVPTRDNATGGVYWSDDGDSIIFVSQEWVVTDNVGGYVYSGRAVPTWETLDDLIAYAYTCCVVRDLTDEERANNGLSPGN